MRRINELLELLYSALGMLFVLVVVISCAPAVEQNIDAVSESEPLDPYPAPLTEINASIQQYEEMLQGESLSEAERHTIEELLAEAQVIATKVSAPTPLPEDVEEEYEIEQTRIAEYQAPSTPTPELGILRDGIYYEINLPRRVLVEDIWQGYVDGNLTRVYAGKLLPDNRTGESQETFHGAIYVMTLLSGGEIQKSLHTTDEETGALRIIDVTGEDRLLLVSEGYQSNSSSEHYFDVQALQFVTSLEQTVEPTLQPELDMQQAYP